MTIFDRKKEYNDKNLSLCASNCIYSDYDNSTKKVICQCEPQSNSSLIILEKIINKENLLQNFKDLKKTTNIQVVTCYKKFLSFKELKSNIGSFILLFIILFYLIGLLAFIINGYKKLEIKLIAF